MLLLRRFSTFGFGIVASCFNVVILLRPQLIVERVAAIGVVLIWRLNIFIVATFMQFNSLSSNALKVVVLLRVCISVALLQPLLVARWGSANPTPPRRPRCHPHQLAGACRLTWVLTATPWLPGIGISFARNSVTVLIFI